MDNILISLKQTMISVKDLQSHVMFTHIVPVQLDEFS